MAFSLLFAFLFIGIGGVFADVDFSSQEQWKDSLLRRTQGTIEAIKLADPARSSYALAVDAGSSHSEVILFTWSGKVKGTGFVRQVANCGVTPGIDKYLSQRNKDNGLLECIRKMLDKIPTSNPGPFAILLGATAGMRIVKLENKERTREIFSAIKDDFENFEHKGRRLTVNTPRILTGMEEGQFAWITANYLMKYIPPEDTVEFIELEKDSDIKSIGILDMGGASAQIAFQTDDDASDYPSLFGYTYGVKSYSNLCFGSDQARLRYQFLLLLNRKDPNQTVVNDPCANDDYPEKIEGGTFMYNPCLQIDEDIKINLGVADVYSFQSNGYDAEQCRAVIEELTDWDECYDTFKYCFEGEEQPLKDQTFYALSSFYWAFRQLPSFSHGKEVITDEKTLLAEIDSWCAKPYAERVKGAKEPHARTLCFKQNFMYYTLTAIYNFDPSIWPHVHFRNDIDGASLGWTMGFTLRKSNLLPDRVPAREKFSDEVIGIYKMVKHLSEEVKKSDANLMEKEKELDKICAYIAEVLNAEIFFAHEQCGIGDSKSDCCRSRFANGW